MNKTRDNCLLANHNFFSEPTTAYCYPCYEMSTNIIQLFG